MILNNNSIYKIHHSNSNLNNINNNVNASNGINPFSFYTKSNYANNFQRKLNNTNSIDFSLLSSNENVHTNNGDQNHKLINLKNGNTGNTQQQQNNNNNNNNAHTHNSSNLYFLDENFKISTKKNNFRTSINEQSKPVLAKDDSSSKSNGSLNKSVLNHHNSFRLPQVKPFDCKYI